MTNILVVYHSQTGNTERMAAAVAEGARCIAETEVIVKKAGEAGIEDLLAADGLAIGTPENFGSLSGMIKDFLERTFYPAQDKVFRKPYVVFVSAGNDGTGAVNAVERIAQGFKFKKVYEPVVCRGEITADVLEACRELGATIAVGCQMKIY